MARLTDQDLPSQYRQVRIGVMLLVVVTVEVCKVYNCWCGMTGLNVQQTYGVLSDLDLPSQYGQGMIGMT